MKYTTKTAIEIMTEEDRLEVIPFFEHHFPNCNNGFWREDEIHIGQIWILNEHLLLNWRERKLLSDYTILKGVPKDWGEESEIPTFEDWFENLTRTESDELEKKYGYYGHDISTTEDEWLGIHNDEFGIKQNKDNSISISKLTETNSRLDQLESENKELRKCLELCIDFIPSHRNELFYQAKQLLEK